MKYLVHVIFPIFLGIIIYFFYRTEDLNIYNWLHLQSVSRISYVCPNWLKYNLPDGLWIYSLTTMMIFIWKKKLHLHSLGWIFSGLIFAIVIEFGQKFGIIIGTFDWMDLTFYIIAFILSCFHLISYNKIKLLLTSHIDLQT